MHLPAGAWELFALGELTGAKPRKGAFEAQYMTIWGHKSLGYALTGVCVTVCVCVCVCV